MGQCLGYTTSRNSRLMLLYDEGDNFLIQSCVRLIHGIAKKYRLLFNA